MGTAHVKDKTKPLAMLCAYVPKPGKDKELFALVQKHWPTLSKLGLVTNEPAKLYRAYDIRKQQSYFVELFTWKTGESSDIAHQTPEVMAIWEPMEGVLADMTLSAIEPVG